MVIPAAVFHVYAQKFIDLLRSEFGEISLLFFNDFYANGDIKTSATHTLANLMQHFTLLRL